MNTARSKRLIAVNTLATLGYISCVAQWLWLVVVYGPLIANSHLMLLLPDPRTNQPALETAQAAHEPSLLIFVIAAAITTIILVATVIVLWKLPRAIGKTGSTLIHKAATFTVPIVTHHKEIKPVKRRMLTARIAVVFKLLAWIIPLLGSLLAFMLDDHPLEYRVIAVLALFFGAGTLFWFSAQYIAAKLLKTPIDKIW